MFEFATRNKLRFPYKGMISAEDLWDLRPTELDKIYKALKSQKKKEDEEESLLATKSAGDVVLDTQIEIVKHIVGVKLTEAEAAKNAKKNKEKREYIMSIIKAKEDQAMHDMSIEELKKMLGE